jgi:hypothetical protein
MGSLRGEAPIIRGWGCLGAGRQPAHPGNAGGVWEGRIAPPSKINYLMSASVRLAICFGSVGFTLKPYMKPTLIIVGVFSKPG